MGAYVRLRRYRGVLLAGLALSGTVIAIDQTLALCFGSTAVWHRPNIFWEFVQRIGSQVAAVEQLQRAGRLPPDQLAVIVGVSSVLRGFDGQRLHECDPVRRHWLVLAGGGGTVSRLETYLQPFLRSGVRCQHVYIGLHPMLLWDGAAPEPLHEDVVNLVADTESALVRQCQTTLLQHAWLGQRWQRAHDTCRVALYCARLALFSAFGLGCETTHPPSPDPWAAYEMRAADRDTPERLAKQWERLRPRCRPERYDAADTERAALKRLVRSLREHGTSVTVLQMPEHSRLRQEIDPRIVAHFDAAVAAAGGTEPLPLLDLSTAVDDELFFDHTHLNTQGRARLSESFPARLNTEMRVANGP